MIIIASAGSQFNLSSRAWAVHFFDLYSRNMLETYLIPTTFDKMKYYWKSIFGTGLI